MSLIKSFAEQATVDPKGVVTREELRDVLASWPLPQMIAKQTNMMAQEINNLQFRWSTFIEYLEIRGMRRKIDGSYRLDRIDWESFLNARIKEVNKTAEGMTKPS